jgi:putative ABC transport system permease protein
VLLSLIIKNFRARRTRSLLTVLGIGISVAVIISIFTIATDLKEELGVAAQITEADLVATQRGLAGPAGGSIPESYVDEIEGYEGVERATGFLVATLSLPESSIFTLFGVYPEDRELYLDEQELVEGTYIQEQGEIVLGKSAKNDLGLGAGGTLSLKTGEELRVAGIYKTGNYYLDSGGMVSLEEAQAIAGREGKVTLIAIYLKPGTDKAGLIAQIESDKQYLKVSPPSELLESPNVDLANAFAWGLSLIVLIMGGMGVVSTMLMSVWERTREIGILKAVGWSQFRVLRMVLGESLLLSLIAFFLGSIMGMIALWVIASLPSVKGYISPSVNVDFFLIGLAVALLLGFLGGLFPAYRALRLSPSEALRHE